VTFRSGRLAVSPIELDSAGARALREELPEAVYESGRATVSVRVPDDAAGRFTGVVAAAEAILRAATEPTARPEPA
jgi:transcription-repair coupling factor (superfamily II helicase)